MLVSDGVLSLGLCATPLLAPLRLYAQLWGGRQAGFRREAGE